MTDATPQKTENWWDAFPAPRAKCPELSADELMKMFDDMDIKPETRSFLLVDVRRTDWEVRSLLRFGILEPGPPSHTSTDRYMPRVEQSRLL
jgi:hypothetical protein